MTTLDSPSRTFDHEDPPRWDDLVVRHMGLAVSLAKRYAGRGETVEDLVQVANIALIKAARRYDAARGVAFSTFATATILGELKRHFRDQRWGVHVSRSAQERYLLVREAVEWATRDLGRSPTVEEIAERAGLSAEQVIDGLDLAAAFHTASLDRTSADDQPSFAELPSVDPGFARSELRADIDRVLTTCSDCERQVLRLRFEENLSQSAIAARIGTNQMQVSRTIARVLERLRRSLAEGC